MMLDEVLLGLGILFSLHFVSINARCCDNTACRCDILSDFTVSADCSNLGLTTSPKFYRNVTIIKLNENNLTSVPHGEAFPTELITLDLSQNNIERFQPNSFKKLKKLKKLNLERNNLLLDSKTYFDGLFRDFTRLEYLNLQNNTKESIAQDKYPEEAFKDLISLKSLKIDGLEKPDFGTGFSQLKKLSHLSISGSTGKCFTKHLTSSAFRHLPNLQYLDLSHCKLREIDEGALAPLFRLEYLDFSYNDELTFFVLRNVTRDLSNSSIKILKFNKIHCTHGIGTQLFISDMEAISDTNLTELWLGSNRLELIQSGVLGQLPKTLKKVVTSDNKFTFGKFALETLNLTEMESFDASMQYFSHTPDLSIFLNKNSSCNDTQHQIPRQSSSSTTLTYSSFQAEGFWDGSGFDIIFIIPLPPNVKDIYFNQSTLRYSIPRMKFAKNKVENVYLQQNVLWEWIGPVENLPTIKTLDLSENYCTHMTPYFFDHFHNLERLYIHDNLLGFNITVDSANDTFKNLKKLNTLDMSNNKIRGLPFYIFQSMNNLQQLNVSGNLLREWKVCFQHMNKLEYLDLSKNQIPYFKTSTMSILDKLSSNLTLDLSENPLQCTCDTLDFLRWMENDRAVKFENFENYTCSTKEGETVSFNNLREEIMNLEKKCSSYIGLITGLTVAILFCISLVICGIVYRYRWKLRYLFYITKNKYRGYSPIGNCGDHFVFDAFISYADEDREFGLFKMKKHLEESAGLRLCFHHRDFIPGNDIAENITNAIHSSRKTVCILSENFIKSYWCKFEFNMARMEGIYSRDGENVLFLVFYKTVPPKDLPLDIMQLIENKSFIEYPDDPQGDIVFWDKIRETIM